MPLAKRETEKHYRARNWLTLEIIFREISEEVFLES